MPETHQRNGHSDVSTGIEGLDAILNGGFSPNRLFLIEGNPGSGKTTLALQYLLDGIRKGERGLYVTLSETKLELEAVAASHGWSLEGVDIFELVPAEDALATESQYTVFHPSEIELNETTKGVLKEVERIKPSRVVFDSLSEMRLLAQSALRYRRQILGLKQFFIGRDCTVLLLDDRTSETGDLQLQSIVNGVISLEQLAPDYGAERRRLRIMKMRGKQFRGGFHDFRIMQGGLEVFPRLVAAEHHSEFSRALVSSGIAEMDRLMGGGLDPGTSTLLMGPAGSGKSSMAVQYAVAAAERGQNAALFIFDESIATLLTRCEGLGIPLKRLVDEQKITVQQVDPAELSPGEFTGIVRRSVDADQAKVIVIDSLNGYLNAMAEESHMTLQLHELLTYLGQKGVTTLLVVAQAGLVGHVTNPVDISYLADTVILFRYFESKGEVRRAVSVVKKRSGSHERTIRELMMSQSGITIGEPLIDFEGVLSGVPTNAR